MPDKHRKGAWKWYQSDRELTNQDWQAIQDCLPLIDKILNYRSMNKKDCFIKQDYEEYYDALLNKLLTGIRTFDHNKGKSFGSYIYRGLHSELSRQLRKRYKEVNQFIPIECMILNLPPSRKDNWFPPEFTHEQTPEKYMKCTESCYFISQKIKELPQPYRKIVKMKIWKDMTHNEIAKKMGVCKRTVEKRFKEALEVLREKFAGEFKFFD